MRLIATNQYIQNTAKFTINQNFACLLSKMGILQHIVVLCKSAATSMPTCMFNEVLYDILPIGVSD